MTNVRKDCSKELYGRGDRLKKRRIGIGILLLGLFLFVIPVEASMLTEQDREKESEQAAELIFDALDMSEVDALLKEMFPDTGVSFQELLEGVLRGDEDLSLETAWDFLQMFFFGEWKEQKSQFVQLILLVVIAAIFHNFSSIFRGGQAAEIGFFAIYLLLVTLCIGSFRDLLEITETRLLMLTDFMRVLSPVYFLATAISTGSTTSLAFYNLILIGVFLVELLMLQMLLPMLQIYLMIRLINSLSTDGKLGKMAELIHMVVEWSLKTILATVIGLNLIQGILSPALDSLKRSTVTKTAEALPIIGDALGGVSEVVLSTAIVIRNGIGVTGAVICIFISVVPMVQIGITCLLYKCIGAFCQPISDQRILGCINGIADAGRLLLRFVFTAGVLFLITIAVVSGSMQGG